MNPTKKAIEDLEKKFDSHEIWTRAEIKQVLNQMWLDSQDIKEYDNPPKICHVTKKELKDDQCYMHEKQNTLFCYCHDQPLEDPQ